MTVLAKISAVALAIVAIGLAVQMNRYEIRAERGYVVRLDRLTGSIQMCGRGQCWDQAPATTPQTSQ